MQHSSGEAHMCDKDDALAGSTARFFGACDRILVGLAILLLVRTSEAVAGDPAPSLVAAARPELNIAREFAPTSALPSFEFLNPPAPPSVSAAEFRPRGQSLLQKDVRAYDAEDPPMLRSTTVWQRLADYRARDRVRVVTLWESGGGTVSLQAGRKGDPSLQWTSRLMNRGGATRGLLDQVVSTSVGRVARSLRVGPRAGGTEAFGKPSKSMDSALSKGGTGVK